jgi:hypothetical protein
MDKIEQAKAILKEAGYFVDLLWHINDVKERYDVSDDEAQEVLFRALENEGTFDHLWFAIDFHAKELLDDTTKI